MLTLRFIAVILVTGVLQQSAPQPPAVPLTNVPVFSVEMSATSYWATRNGRPFEYRLVLRADGTASFTGTRKAGEWGVYLAKYPAAQFERLAQFIQELNVEQFKSQYMAWPAPSDGEWVSVNISYEGEPANRQIAEYGGCGPALLWGFQQVIWAFSEKLQWQLQPAEAPK